MSNTTHDNNTVSYCAYDSYKKSFIQAIIFILIAFPLMCILAKQGPFSKRLLPFTILVIFFLVFFIAMFSRAKKMFETIYISDKHIKICLPGKETIEIPWSEAISVGAFSGVGSMARTLQAPGKNWFELVLSSEKPSSVFQVDSILRFSPEKFRETGSWRVSLGRGNRKWCEKQIEIIENMKQKALSN